MGEVEALARENRVGDPQLMERFRPLRDRIRREFKDVLEGGQTSKLGAVLISHFVAHNDEQAYAMPSSSSGQANQEPMCSGPRSATTPA